jgi:hypothetical protein
VDAGADDGPAGRERAQPGRHERARRGEDQRRVERLGRQLAGDAHPLGPELARERLRVVIARAREREDPPPLPHRDLADDVRGRAEPVEPEPLRVAAHPQGAVADQPCAQQGRGLQIGVAVGDRQAEALVGDGVVGEAAVDVASGEARPHAEVLAAAAAVGALAAGPAEPRHPDATVFARDHADDLMAEHARRRDVELAVEQVQIGAADAARPHLEQQLAQAGLRYRTLDEPQRAPGRLEHHRPAPGGSRRHRPPTIAPSRSSRCGTGKQRTA